MNELLLWSPRQSSHGTFRDDSVRRLARRYGWRERRRRTINMLAAACLLASAAFGATMLAAPPTSQASLAAPQTASCVKAGQGLEPWFKAELLRRAWAGSPRQDDFNLMLTWFRDAQGQCAAGLTDVAAENLHALADRISAREGHRQSMDD